LGESDPTKFTVGQNPKSDTAADNLAACLYLAQAEWKSPLWGRLALAYNPRVDAVSKALDEATGEPKRLTFPIILQLFVDEADARKKVADELEEGVAAGLPPVPASANGSQPAIPAAWAARGEEQLRQYVVALTEPYKGKPRDKALEGLKKIEPTLKQYQLTAQELHDWAVYLNIFA
jgi:hypothetical protein